ncbi:hypothetical protein [Geobacter sulfurreducens]|uniref:hypothetical protein n=1 Tax=Geobacter sulfurreducens TaxID=35554 RepID=UPI00257466F8|nr:hypothetical protein [Geobacter sulfurreducens]
MLRALLSSCDVLINKNKLSTSPAFSPLLSTGGVTVLEISVGYTSDSTKYGIEIEVPIIAKTTEISF